MTPAETFAKSLNLAIKEAEQQNKRFFVLYPDIANPGIEGMCHLLVGVVAEDALNHNEKKDVALTIFPDGAILPGLSPTEPHDDPSDKRNFRESPCDTLRD